MRAAGILLHITSLPSPYGIGTLGAPARAFIDFLERSRQRDWQMLPIGPAGGGNSPYSPLSCFAGNVLLIDPEDLAARGLLRTEELKPLPARRRVDYAAAGATAEERLRLAFSRLTGSERKELLAWSEEKPHLRDYGLFLAARRKHGGAPWTAWEDGLRLRRPGALAKLRRECAEELAFSAFCQKIFLEQWAELRAYANAHGIRLIGDIPIYAALDSADVWANPSLFSLDADRRPLEVAGCPPDYFSEDGQLWGNPVYRWEEMKQDGYAWWMERIRCQAELFDVIRIDHFRGFESYFAIPAEAESARSGVWKKGPGMDFFRAMQRAGISADIIAEDLGTLTPEVFALLAETGFPGMKVLQFGFDSMDEGNHYLPRNYSENCVCYTGTHDNDTTTGWYQHSSSEVAAFARRLTVPYPDETFCDAAVRMALGSRAARCIIPMQDYLGLGSAARMNVPSVPEGNWGYRLQPGQLCDALSDKIRFLTECAGRAPG